MNSTTMQHAATPEQIQEYKQAIRDAIEKAKRMMRAYISEEMLWLKQQQREYASSRLAQFGKTFPNKCRRHVFRSPYWFRVRSFCVRSAYG